MKDTGKPSPPEGKSLVRNRKAAHDYVLFERFEAGIELQGTEVKSLRAGRGELKDAYAIVKGGEVFLLNCHIAPWTHSAYGNHDPERTRRLLLHKAQIRKIAGNLEQKGLTLIPTRIYTSARKIKIEIALARGKTLYDKRETERRRTADREARQAIRERSGR